MGGYHERGSRDTGDDRGDQSPMAEKLKLWQKELKTRLGEALKQLEPDNSFVH